MNIHYFYSFALFISFFVFSFSLPTYYSGDHYQVNTTTLRGQNAVPCLDTSDPTKANDPVPIQRRDELPPRSNGLNDGYFHDLQFENLEAMDYAPAIDAMPVWLYARTTMVNVTSISLFFRRMNSEHDSRIHATPKVEPMHKVQARIRERIVRGCQPRCRLHGPGTVS